MIPQALRSWVLPAAIVVAVAIVVVVVVGRLNRLGARATEAERKAAAAELRAQGFAVAKDATQKALASQVEKSQILLDEIERLKKAAPGTTIVGALTGSTGWFSLTPPTLPPSVPGQQAQRVCMVWSDEALDIRARGALARTPEGVIVGAGVASLWILPRGQNEVRIWNGPLRLELEALPPSAPPGWGAGLALVGFSGPGGGGWWAGPLVSPPPLHLFGLDLSAIVGGGAGMNGAWGGLAGGLVRW